MKIGNGLFSDSPWEIHERSFDPDAVVTTGSTFMLANGYLGYRGTFSDDQAEDYVALVLTDTYDNADGKWRELVTTPNPLYLTLQVDGVPLRARNGAGYRRGIDLETGTWSRSGVHNGLHWEEERIVSYGDLHILAARHVLVAERALDLSVTAGIDGEVWSLNGNHFVSCVPNLDREDLVIDSVTGEKGVRVSVRSRLVGLDLPQTKVGGTRALRTGTLHMETGQRLEILVLGAVASGNDAGADPAASLSRAAALGWEGLHSEHRSAWRRLWNDMDVRIQGDDRDQLLLRYNLWHNIIATPAHADHLPVGARGLSCQAYQGAAFWDQEIFNLPMFLYTRPEIARRLLTYRHKTIEGARRKARKLGYEGAFYAWVSADDGAEICPDYFFKDLLSGRRIRNHFNDWQIHVSMDIAYTVERYVEATGDMNFLAERGAEIVLDVARFVASRVHFNPKRECYQILRVLGPDEYHENVDDNVFTNYQARHALRYALQVLKLLGREGEDPDADLWRDIAERIYLPEPDPETGLIEQFDGFFDLEDITPTELKKRLIDPGEYWGWPNGIAVETQVSKQADVTQLFMMHPRAYDESVMRANWEYYEPRTQHGSSLSPAVYACTAAWVGHLDEAKRYFETSCTIDLLNTNKAVSGGTFIGGIHTAAAGAAWQIVVLGFAGMRHIPEGLVFSPKLPEGWAALEFSVRRFGRRINVRLEPTRATVRASSDNRGPIVVQVFGVRVNLGPGQGRDFF